MPNTPDQHLLDELYRELKGHSENGNGYHKCAPSILSDAQVIEQCRKAKNAPKFASLFDEGDTSSYPSPSEADLSLIGFLGFYTQDAEQLDRLYRRSALMRDKWNRHDYRTGTINRVLDNLGETYTPQGGTAWLKENVSSSSSPLGVSDDDDTSDEIPGLVRFANTPVPEPVNFLLENVIPEGYVTNIHGAGGFGKSVLAMLVALSISGYQKECLGLKVNRCGEVLYLDSELDARGQHPRVAQLCKGLDIPIPDGLHYLSALGLDTATAFKRAYRVCEKEEIKLLVIDSWGPLMDGDMESARDVIRFYNNYLKPFVDLGVTVLTVDHQARTQEGQNYQRKGAFGSVYKENLARSVLQIERVEEDREAGTIRVRVRHRKSNFGPRRDPFDVIITFGSDRITAKASEIEETEKATEETVNSRDRILAAVKDGPLTAKEIAEDTGLSYGTVRNRLSELVPDELCSGTPIGERVKVYGYPDAIEKLSSSPPHPTGSDSDDTSNEQPTPASFGLKPGESSTVGELQDAQLAEFLEDPPEWFKTQAEDCVREGIPERLLNPLANAVSVKLYGGPHRWREIKPTIGQHLRGEESKADEDEGRIVRWLS